jgi:hypothetical protein
MSSTLNPVSTRPVNGRQLRGVEEVVAANVLLPPRIEDDPLRGPSLTPPVSAIDIYVSSSVAAPSPTTLTLLLAYQVPSGHQFALTGVMWTFDSTTGTYVPGSVGITWTLDVNNPLTASALAISGRYVQGFGAEAMPIGSVEKPWKFPRPRIFAPSDLLQLKVLTTSAISANSGVFNSRFIGYLWPAGE